MTSTYKHGLPFSKIVHENLVTTKERVDKKKASLWIVDGGVGEGKTTLGVELADDYNALYGVPPIDLTYKKHPQLAVGGSDFLKKLRICYEEKLPVIIYDEAGDFSKRGSVTRFNAMLNRTFETYRGFKILVILGLPKFTILDANLFDMNIPRGLLHTHDRNEKYGNFAGYSLVQMNWIRYWFDKLPKGIKYKCYDKVTPNFRGHFKDISTERSNQLDLISTKSKLAVLKKAEVKVDGLLSYKELSDKLCRSIIWVKKAINQELKIKPTRMIDRAKYFDENVLNRLSDYLDEKNERNSDKSKE